MTRASMLDVLAQDYIRTAEAKGLAPDQVLIGHALKNAAIPVVTIIGIGIALLISGAIVTETVFALPGIGRLTVDAILRRDYPDHPGRDPDLFRGLRAGQSRGRSVVRAVRSAHPLLTWIRHARFCRRPVRTRRCRRHGGASATRSGGIRRRLVGGVILVVHGRDRGARAVARHGRPAGGVADQAAEAAVGRVLVRHRHARPRRLQPRRLRLAGLAHRRPCGRDALDRCSGSRSDSSPATCAGSTPS